MYRQMYTLDAQQQALAFLIRQSTHIEQQVAEVRYPDIQYPGLIPVDTSANEWAPSVTYFSVDRAGRAEWFNHQATSMPLADITREKFEQTVEMAAIGYRYTLEEIGRAMLIPGTNLSNDRAASAKRAAEEFIDDLAINGDSAKNIDGLVNHSSVTVVDAQDDGTQNSQVDSPAWADKTADQILRDINDNLTGLYTASNTVEMADTVLLPPSEMSRLATKRVPDTQISVLEFLAKHNVYTAQTGQQLVIRGVRGLETAGEGSTGRMILYRRDPEVLKLHMPMTHRFLPVWQTGPLIFDVPGIFRLGGLEIRRPGAVRYVDRIIDASYE